MKSLFQKLILALGAVGACVLAFSMFITTADVILRYFFHSPIKGVYELIELLMGILSPIAILYCSYKKAHVSVDIVYNQLPYGARRITLAFSLACSLLVFAVLAWQGFYLVEEIIESHMSTPTLDLPMWPAAVAIFISFLLIVPITIGEIVMDILHGPGEAPSEDDILSGHSGGD